MLENGGSRCYDKRTAVRATEGIHGLRCVGDIFTSHLSGQLAYISLMRIWEVGMVAVVGGVAVSMYGARGAVPNWHAQCMGTFIWFRVRTRNPIAFHSLSQAGRIECVRAWGRI